MKFSADRLSGLFFLLFGIAMYVAVIPNYVDTIEGGNVAPSTLPNYASVLIAVCGFLLVLKPTDWQAQDPRLFAVALIYGAVVAAGVYAMSWFGFVWVGPVLALAIMLLIGERRPLWLLSGVVGTPLAIWLFVVQVLDRTLP